MKDTREERSNALVPRSLQDEFDQLEAEFDSIAIQLDSGLAKAPEDWTDEDLHYYLVTSRQPWVA